MIIRYDRGVLNGPRSGRILLLLLLSAFSRTYPYSQINVFISNCYCSVGRIAASVRGLKCYCLPQIISSDDLNQVLACIALMDSGRWIEAILAVPSKW
jgi:hypothetical protein